MSGDLLITRSNSSLSCSKRSIIMVMNFYSLDCAVMQRLASSQSASVLSPSL